MELVDTNPTASFNVDSPRPAKRKRYTPRACDQCKTRKVKCDGQTPCYRCSRQSGECFYTQRVNNADSRQEYDWKAINEKIERLQEQVNILVSNASMCQLAPPSPVSTVRWEHTSPLPVTGSGPLPGSAYEEKLPRPARHPHYMGPTSSSFTFKVAKSSLEGMGIQATNDPKHDALASQPTLTPNSQPVSTGKDPLYTIPQIEAIRLIETYEEQCGSLYPFLDIDLLLETARNAYRSAEAGCEPSVIPSCPDENMFSGGILDVVKLVIAISLVIEAGGPTNLSTELLETVEAGFKGRFCGLSVGMFGIQALTLMGILQFHCNEEILAWRVIGFASRAAIEIGLHRHEMYLTSFQNQEERFSANKAFWCIYVLDRRWSLGTGLPFTIQDHDVDPDLPRPTGPNSSVLRTMITYAEIGSKVWIATTNSKEPAKTDKLAFLDFQVREWQTSIPPELQLQSRSDDMLDGHSPVRNRLRVLLYLRANQMRLLLFRRTLFTRRTINGDVKTATSLVEVAKDTIRVIHKLNQLSDIYSSQQTCFNYFLVTALGVLFLAVCHGAPLFNDSCRIEFTMALDLVRGFKAKSYVARKLWKSIKHLKVIGPKLGIPANQERVDMPDSTTPSIPNNGLDSLAAIPLDLSISPTYSYLDGDHLSNELTNLFEAIEPGYSEFDSAHANERLFDFPNPETTEELSRSLMQFF